jgi:hypothetical protein
MSASAYSLSAAIPAEGFELIAGETVIGGLHGDEAQHHFCAHCMTWIFTKPVAVGGFVNLRPTMLDDANWFSPFIETYVSEKLPWATTPATHSFEQFPAFEDYARLTEAFAGEP